MKFQNKIAQLHSELKAEKVQFREMHISIIFYFSNPNLYAHFLLHYSISFFSPLWAIVGSMKKKKGCEI